MASFKITNIVAKLKCDRFDLTKLSRLAGVRCNSGKLSLAHMTLSSGSVNIFASGTIVFLGYKDVDSITEGILELAACIGSGFKP